MLSFKVSLFIPFYSAMTESLFLSIKNKKKTVSDDLCLVWDMNKKTNPVDSTSEFENKKTSVLSSGGESSHIIYYTKNRK